MEFDNQNLRVIKKNGLEFIQFNKLLDYGIKHAYTLKSNNIDFSFNQELNKKSYEKICEILDINKEIVVQPVQTHTDKIKCIDRGMGEDELQNIDGLITNKKNIALTTKNADCILFLFYDPIKNVIANIHSGWRGTFQKIAEKAVIKMINFYGCNPKDILCFICPCIRQDHFEVDEEVKFLCENIFSFMKVSVSDYIQKGKIIDGVQKYNIDAVLINKLLLLNVGLQEENIIDSEICSACNGDKIESVRVDKDKAKRATAIIVM